MKYKHMITTITVCTYPEPYNDLLMVFDQNGEQMPNFQGERTYKSMKKIKDRIVRQKTPVTWRGTFKRSKDDHRFKDSS